MPVTGATLSTCAPELFEMICSHIDVGDLCKLRGLSKAMKERATVIWAKRCFKTFTTDLSSQSINKLAAMSKYEILRKTVVSLYIKASEQNTFGEGLMEVRPPHGAIVRSYRAYSTVFDLLGDLLSEKFSNCRSFYIRSAEAPDFVGISLSERQIVNVIFDLVSRVAIRPEVLVIDLNENYNATFGGYRLLGATPVNPASLTFAECWEDLKELHLKYTLHSETDYAWFFNLFKLTPRLNRLTFGLGLRELDLDHTTIEFKPPQLQELNLFGTSISENVFLTFLANSTKTLRALGLSDVTLVHGTWKSLFHRLRTNYPELETLTLVDLFSGPFIGMEDDPDPGKVKRVAFAIPVPATIPTPAANETDVGSEGKTVQRGPDVVRLAKAIKYSGQKMSTMLMNLMNCIQHLSWDK